jgi:hypothetical protein
MNTKEEKYYEHLCFLPGVEFPPQKENERSTGQYKGFDWQIKE